jgi:hypothetical protein
VGLRDLDTDNPTITILASRALIFAVASDAVHVRHIDIHNDNMRSELIHSNKWLIAVGSLANDFNFRGV